MKLSRLLPPLLYGLALAGCLVMSVRLAPELQGRIATHFGAAGQADGWMQASAFKTTFLWLVLGISLFVPVIMGSLRFIGARWVNIPNKAYWTQPGNWREACDFLFFSSFWVATAEVLFFAGLFYLTVAANRLTPPALDGRVWGLTAAFLLALLAWIVRGYVFFSRKSR